MNKFIFLFKKPKVVIVAGQARETAAEAVSQLLKQHFKVGKEILIFSTDLKDLKEFQFLVEHASLLILLVTHVGQYYPDKEFFAAEIDQVSQITKLAESLPGHAHLVLNFDDETVREIKDKSEAHPLTFGFGVRADIKATDIVLMSAPSFGTNFKINYGGKIVPVWLENLFGKTNIYSALSAISVGDVLGLNLVEISEALKSYQGLPGNLRLIKGIKHTFILDNSASPSCLATMEGLDVLAKIETQARKIAVLGDVLGIGKYTIEAHEAIGEKAAKSADLLFTLGSRAKFIARGAQTRGLGLDKIFQYDIVSAVGIDLQKNVQRGDLVFISGIREEMKKIIREVIFTK